MTKQIFLNRWFIWALAAIIIVGFSVWGFIEYSAIKTANESAENGTISLRHPVSKVVENKIYSVDELVKSNLIEGTEVLVKGRYGIELINAGPDYEGPGGGSYLFGQTEKIHISFNGLPNTETNQVITMKGKVKYCGGKKLPKYLCALTGVRVLNIEAFEIKKIVSEICERNKEYEFTAVNSIKCQCPEGYKFQVVSMGWGPCPEPGMSDCPASKQKCVSMATTEKSCSVDSDCACGVKIDTKECFFGNKNYVNVMNQCPDFCSGIDGKITTKCVNNLCQQVQQ